jgi:hypothetical protein
MCGWCILVALLAARRPRRAIVEPTLMRAATAAVAALRRAPVISGRARTSGVSGRHCYMTGRPAALRTARGNSSRRATSDKLANDDGLPGPPLRRRNHVCELVGVVARRLCKLAADRREREREKSTTA